MALLRNIRNIIKCGVTSEYHEMAIKKLTNRVRFFKSSFCLIYVASFDTVTRGFIREICLCLCSSRM